MKKINRAQVKVKACSLVSVRSRYNARPPIYKTLTIQLSNSLLTTSLSNRSLSLSDPDDTDYMAIFDNFLTKDQDQSEE